MPTDRRDIRNKNGVVPPRVGRPPRRVLPPQGGREAGPELGPDRTLLYILIGAGGVLLFLLAIGLAFRGARPLGKSGTGSGREAAVANGGTGSEENRIRSEVTGNSGGVRRDGKDRLNEDKHPSNFPENGPSSNAASDDSDDDSRLAQSDAISQKISHTRPGHSPNVTVIPPLDEKYVPSFSTFGGVKNGLGADDDKTDKPADGDGTIEFFGVAGSGSQIVYVIDMSGSMAGYRFARAREELLESIRRLNRDQYFCVCFFHSAMVAPMGTKLERANSRAKKKIRKAIMSMSPFDGTNPTEAMRLAIGLEPDVIYLLSDGEFDSGTTEAVNEMNRHAKIVINTIGFQVDSKSLRQIANDNRGEYRFVP